MYRARWRKTDSITKLRESNRNAVKPDELALTAVGAITGVSAIATLGVWKSIGMTPYSLGVLYSTFPLGGTDDVSVYTTMITDWVANANAPVGNTPQVIYGLSTSFDAAAVVLMVAGACLVIADMLTATDHTSEELCLATEKEQVCGPVSFDSTDDFACIEREVNGQLQWICA